MDGWICRALGWGVVAGLAAGMSGCATTASQEATTTTELIYDKGRAAPPRIQQPVAQVVVGREAPAPRNDAPGIVYFDFDRYDIKPQYRDDLERHAGMLRADRAAIAVIEGHTDPYGSVEYNLALGQRRAEAVRRALTQLGVQDTQLEAVSFGELKPAVPGEDAPSRAMNRRAEIHRPR